MRHLSVIIGLAAVQICSAPASARDCQSLSATATLKGVRVPDHLSGYGVIGKGRLQFYSAPSKRCKMNGVFILSGESVHAYRHYQGFTSVMYMNPRTGADASGWVESARLEADSVIGTVRPRAR